MLDDTTPRADAGEPDPERHDMEKLAERAKRDIDVPWDDVRAARVQKSALEAFRAAKREDEARVRADEAEEQEQLEAFEAKLDRKSSPLLVPVRWPVWAAFAAVLAAAAALVFWLRTPEETTSTAWVVASLDYRDGSRSLMSERAQVQVVDDSEQQVRVRQRAGRVRYDVTKRPERRFQVGVHDITITVLGTVFDVDVEEGSVTVEVGRGRVQVDHRQPDGTSSQVILTAGQRVTIATSGGDGVDEPALSLHPPVGPSFPPPVGPGAKAAATESEPEESDEPHAQIDPVVVGGGSPVESAADLFRQADEARAQGNDAIAIARLRTLIQTYPRDPRVTAATFTIGRILRKQGRHAEAAQAFERCGAALQGDAIAEAAAAWQAAGDGARAQTAAQRYLGSFPRGVHADHMRKLVPASGAGGT